MLEWGQLEVYPLGDMPKVLFSNQPLLLLGLLDMREHIFLGNNLWSSHSKSYPSLLTCWHNDSPLMVLALTPPLESVLEHAHKLLCTFEASHPLSRN